jgi:hypothetical protein
MRGPFHKSMPVDRDKLITFLLIDAVNDDLRGLWELSSLVEQYFEEHGLGTLDEHALTQAALQLCHDDLVRLELVSSYGLDTIRELSHDTDAVILCERANWFDRTSKQIYAATIVDADKSIALENRLWKELGNDE